MFSFSTFSAALIFLLSLKHSAAYFVTLDANSEECFFDKVSAGTKMSLMFEVAEGGFLDVDVKVCKPSFCYVYDL